MEPSSNNSTPNSSFYSPSPRKKKRVNLPSIDSLPQIHSARSTKNQSELISLNRSSKRSLTTRGKIPNPVSILKRRKKKGARSISNLSPFKQIKLKNKMKKKNKKTISLGGSAPAQYLSSNNLPKNIQPIETDDPIYFSPQKKHHIMTSSAVITRKRPVNLSNFSKSKRTSIRNSQLPNISARNSSRTNEPIKLEKINFGKMFKQLNLVLSEYQKLPQSKTKRPKLLKKKKFNYEIEPDDFESKNFGNPPSTPVGKLESLPVTLPRLPSLPVLEEPPKKPIIVNRKRKTIVKKPGLSIAALRLRKAIITCWVPFAIIKEWRTKIIKNGKEKILTEIRDRYPSFLQNCRREFLVHCRAELRVLWFNNDSFEIIYNKEWLARYYRSLEFEATEAEVLSSLKFRSEMVHSRVMGLIYCITQSFKKFSKQIPNYLNLWMRGTTFIPSGFLDISELNRIRFGPTGNIENMSDNLRKMIIVSFLIFRVLMNLVLPFPELDQQGYSLYPKMRLYNFFK